jgi:tetratricopeptide (TPR) repeat protein
MSLLSELAFLLGQPALAQVEPEQRADTLRALLAKSKTLLVVDNLETFEERERVKLYDFFARLPLSCKAIVTSRRRNDIDARIIRLDRLSQHDALAFLDQLALTTPPLAKADEQSRRLLYESTQGNPLLIQWMVGQMVRGRCRTVLDACDFLRAAPTENDPLEYIFGDLVDSFAPTEIKVLAALSHFREAVPVKRVADVAGIAEWQVQTVLEDLSYRAMTLSDSEARTYALPSLAGNFLRRKNPQAIYDTGAKLAARVYELVVKHAQYTANFPHLEADWPLLNAALGRFIEGDNERLQKLAHMLDRFMEFSGHWDEWLWLSQQGEIKALMNGDLFNAGWSAYRAGWVFYLRGQIKQVLSCADRAAEHWREAQASAREQATALYLSGHARRLAGDFKTASVAYRQAVELWQSHHPDSHDVAIGLNALANAEKDAGNFAAARQDYQHALALAQQLTYQEGIAYITGNLAELALRQALWTEAETLAQQALQLSETVGRHDLIALDCQRLAKILVQQQRLDEAKPFAQRAVEIYEQLRMPGYMQAAQAILAACKVG